MTQRPHPTKTPSTYPRDRFDDVPPYDGRRGAHRSAPPVGAGPSGLVGISIAAAFALVVGAFCFLVLPSLLPASAGGSGATSGAAISTPSGGASEGTSGSAEATDGGDSGRAGETAGAQSSESAGDESAGSAPAGSEAADGEPSETASGSPSAEPTETASEEPEESEPAIPDTGDTSAPVEVYNATNVGGLAGRISGGLSANGFAVVTSANWQGFTVPQSAVYYSRNPTTAQAVAAQLGLPLVQDARIPGVAVVLAADYSG